MRWNSSNIFDVSLIFMQGTVDVNMQLASLCNLQVCVFNQHTCTCMRYSCTHTHTHTRVSRLEVLLIAILIIFEKQVCVCISMFWCLLSRSPGPSPKVMLFPSKFCSELKHLYMCDIERFHTRADSKLQWWIVIAIFEVPSVKALHERKDFAEFAV